MAFVKESAFTAHAALTKNASLNRLPRRCPEASTHLEEYRRFLALKVASHDWYDSLISPSRIVETIWCAHLLDTFAYAETCSEIGVPPSVRIIHHNPVQDNLAVRQERARKYEQLTFPLSSSLPKSPIGPQPPAMYDHDQPKKKKQKTSSCSLCGTVFNASYTFECSICGGNRAHIECARERTEHFFLSLNGSHNFVCPSCDTV